MRLPRFSPWLLVATLAAAGAAAAAGYGATAPKRYRATAQLLVQPVSAADSTFAGVDVLRDTSGRRTAAASAAELIRSPQVADAVRAQLGLAAGVPLAVEAAPAGESDVVEVTAEGSTPTSAAQLANAFVDALIAQRTQAFQSQLAAVVRRDAELLASGSAGPQAVELARRLAVLRSFQGQPAPPVRRASTAPAPRSPAWPDVPALVAAGTGAGLIAGLLLVLVQSLLRWRPAATDAALEERARRATARERALAARERDLRATIEELRSAAPAPAAGAATEAALAAREAALADRERVLAERVEVVTRRERELARRAAAAARREAPPLPSPAPPPVPEPAPAAAADGAYNLLTLERLVDEHADRYPERVEEWRSYLYLLRSYAAPDGSLPGSFDWLVVDTFRELVP